MIVIRCCLRFQRATVDDQRASSRKTRVDFDSFRDQSLDLKSCVFGECAVEDEDSAVAVGRIIGLRIPLRRIDEFCLGIEVRRIDEEDTKGVNER